MTQQPTTEHQEGFFKNDRKLVCSMLVVYGLCILGSIAATFWGLNSRRLTLSANATSTAFAVATQKANVTATVISHATKQAGYEFVDRFDDNKNDWRSGPENSKYWYGSTTIKDGVYIWKVSETKDGFISWSDFSLEDRIGDFDAYVDTKVAEGAPGDVCSGILFRIAPASSAKSYYYFALCNNSTVKVSYHTKAEGWENITTVPYYRRSKDWNRLEINARGSHFTFLVNNEQVYEMDDKRQSIGGLALVIELHEKNPAEILFDNFGFQSR
jgi:hypothetical protein